MFICLFMKITVGHSPDSDDYFMFWALKENLIDTMGFEFSFQARDTAELNQAAVNHIYDVVAISAAIYPQIQHSYILLPFGASVGRNYGPKVVSERERSISDLNYLSIAIPGETTTAALLLRRIAPSAHLIPYPISPYERVFTAMSKGEVDAALLIHEGQLNYRKRSLKMIVDLGVWWHETTQLPLPLGLNAIAKNLGKETISVISNLIRNSIIYAQQNIDAALDYLIVLNRHRELVFSSKGEIAQYLEMYVNKDSLTIKPDVISGLEVLLQTKNGCATSLEWAK